MTRNEPEEIANMPTKLQSRTQFLALAEFCQKVIATLCDYIADEALDTATLEQVYRALDSVRSGDPYRFGQRSAAAAFNSYEQLRTLEQAWTEDQIAETIRLTKALLARGSEDNSTKQEANDLLELFSQLQTKALWNFEQPSPTPPPDLRELCATFKTV